MKLHLPKLLRLVVIAAVCGAGITQAAQLTYIKDVDGNYLYDVGEAGTTQPSLNKTTYQGNLTLNNQDTLGIYVANQLLTSGFGSYNNGTKTGFYTNNLSVSGDLILNDHSKVVLGGQYKITSSKIDEFTGVFADSVEVNDNATLIAGKTKVSNLTATGNAKVLLHNTGYSNYTGGNTRGNYGFSDMSKTSEITDTITVKDKAQVVIGVDNGQNPTSKTAHWLNLIGGTITQSSATGTEQSLLQLKGKTSFTGNLNIQQSGGKMEIGLLSQGNNKSFVFLGGSGNNVINQTGDATLKIGQMISAVSGSAKARQLTITQSGSGTIILDNGVEFKTSGTNYSTITQTGGGTVKLTGNFTSATFNVDLTKGTLALTSASTELKSNEVTLASGAQLDNNGVFTVGTGTAGAAGVLNVTTGGKLNVTLDGTKAAINVGAADTNTNTVTGWEMSSDSALGIGFTSNYFNSLTVNTVTGTDTKELEFSDVLVASVAAGSAVDTSKLQGKMEVGDVAGSDSRHWSVGTSTTLEKDNTTGNIVLSGSLIYNPWIKVVEGGVIDESFSDTNAGMGLYTGLDISGADATLAGNNSHTFGTKIDGVKVTLAHENALGAQPASNPAGTVMVETSGTSSLIADVENGKANLPGAIKNTGTLTMQGAFSASNLAQETLSDAYVDIDGSLTSGGDGFMRDDDKAYRVVTNEGTSASLIVGEGTSITIGGTDDYTLLSNGLAVSVDYTTYHINEALDPSNPDGAKLSELMDASGNQLDTVEMDNGKLTVDTDSAVTVNSTGGELVVGQGTVNGDLVDTTVTISGGEVGASIEGTSSVAITGDTTLSGDNDYSGATTIDGADVTLKNANALKGSPVTTKGESSLSTEGGVSAELAGSIQNEGSLTMSGTYTGSNFMTEASDSTRVCVDGVEGNNGFLREGTSVIVAVQNINGGTLTLDGSAIIKYNSEDYHLSTSGKAGKLDMGHYLIAEDAHSVRMSQIIGAGGSSDTTVEMQAGVLKADADVNDLQASSGTLEVTGTTTVDGAISGDTQVKLGDGATLAGKLSGGAKVEVTDGTATISGDNSHTGGTEIANGAKLKLGSADALGAGAVALRTGGILDLAGYAVSNYINVTGCTLCGADAYTGNVDVSGSLNLDGNATANKVTMVNGGTITPLANETLTVNTIEVVGADSTVGADLTVNPNGLIILNNGVILNLTGSLTLGNGATIVLHGQNYTTGSTLMTVNGDMNRTTGSVTLDYGFGTYALVGNEVRLMAIFDQNIADAMVQANWGIVTASRAFVHAVRGQRTNTGCIANGRGTAWAAVLGAHNDLDGGDINLKGAAVGADMKVGSRSSVGMAIGYLDGEVSPTGLSEVDQEGTYVALYGEHGLRKLSATSCLSADWVVAYGQTESKYKGMSWDQDSLQLNGRLSWNKQLSERLGLRVFGGLEYFTSDSDTVNGIKTGSIDNLRGELGVGVDYVAWGMPVDEKSAGMGCKRLVLHGELRYFNDLDRENPVVEMDGLSGRGENPGRSGVGIDVGATYRINDRWSTSANYSYSTMDGSTEHRLNVGASYTF